MVRIVGAQCFTFEGREFALVVLEAMFPDEVQCLTSLPFPPREFAAFVRLKVPPAPLARTNWDSRFWTSKPFEQADYMPEILSFSVDFSIFVARIVLAVIKKLWL